MPISNITTNISTLPPAGVRGVDIQDIFVTKQEDFQDHLQGITVGELNALKTDLNSRIGEINSTTTTMNGYASTASSGASTATTKAGEASTSAGEALTSRNQASTFASNASTSATKASQWADNAYNVEVETGKYSAKHWSTIAQNASANKVDKVTSTDNAIVRFNGTTGDVQNSGIRIDDAGNILIDKPLGGVTTVTSVDGVGNTNLVLPERGTVATESYVNSRKDISYKSTPISITSWSYVGTTITLNVASHSFIAGDYIEVAGLTATTYPANGIHLVTSVTGTTIVFTLGATPTGTAGVSSAIVKGIATLNGKIIDTSKTMEDKSSSRTLSTTYYNTSGKQKHISIMATGTAGQAAGVYILKNGIQVSYSFIVAIAGTTIVVNPQADIENGDSYSVANAGGAFTSLLWLETI